MRIRKDLVDRAACQRYPDDIICPGCLSRHMRMETMHQPHGVYRINCGKCGYSHTETWEDYRPVKVVIHGAS